MRPIAAIAARKNCRLPVIMAVMVTAATTALLLQSAIVKDDSNTRLMTSVANPKSPLGEEKQIVNEELFRRRREKAAEACRKHLGYDPGTFDASTILGDAVDRRELNFQDFTFYDDNFGFLFCTIPKVASTNIKEMLIALLNRKPTSRQGPTNIPFNPRMHSANLPHIHRLIELDMLEGVPFRMTYHPRIIVVRHPIERLISAWRNKFLLAEPKHLEIEKIADHIIEKYRHNGTLPESYTAGNKPVTLVEFFKFLSEEGSEKPFDDVHWRKYVNHCDPCRVSYDYIAHYENLDQELGYIMNVTTGIPNILSSLPKPDRDSFATATKDQNGVSLRSKYAKRITGELLQQVIDRYAADFDIFGYDKRNVI